MINTKYAQAEIAIPTKTIKILNTIRNIIDNKLHILHLFCLLHNRNTLIILNILKHNVPNSTKGTIKMFIMKNISLSVLISKSPVNLYIISFITIYIHHILIIETADILRIFLYLAEFLSMMNLYK